MAAVSPTLLAVLTIGVGALILGILIGMYTIPPSMTPENAAIVREYKRLTKNYYDPENEEDPVYQALINGPDRESIRKNLQMISIKPHQAGSQRDEELAQFFKNEFLKAGLDRAYSVPYKVLLSYSNPERPNKIYLNDESTGATIISEHQEPPLRPDEMANNNVPAYNAYAPKDDITGEPVYCNYGRVEDFELLEDEARIDLALKICLIRNGRTHRGNKVANAARFGCSAVILFSDPESMAPFNTTPDAVYPNSIWMNGKAMQRGNVRLVKGDPLTPGFPSVIDGYREDETDTTRVHLPKIPCQPVGYDDAKKILSQMKGPSTEDNVKFGGWTGKLQNITYRLGPGFMSQSLRLRIVINNELVEKVVYNVIGVLDGLVEPDRYVLVGNHRDAWSFGAMDAASGGVALLESAKSFGRHHQETGWRPRRSLVFASWAAEELGLIGSTEWVEELRQTLSSDAISYINIDTCVYGPVFHPDASPELSQALRDATKRVPAHHPLDEGALSAPNRTLYESWAANMAGSETEEEVPVDTLSAGSDHMPFTFGTGVPSINLHFKHDKNKYPVNGYPAYHTGYETFYLVQKFIDPDFAIHQSCSRLVSMLLYSIACSTIIPARFAQLNKQIADDYDREVDKPLTEALATVDGGDRSLEFLRKSMKQFAEAATQWDAHVTAMNVSGESPLAIRRLNDRIIAAERSFVPEQRNLLYGTVASDAYRTVLFPGIHDLLWDIRHQQTMKIRRSLGREEFNQIETALADLRRTLRRHLNDIGLAFRRAARLLTPDERMI